MRSCIIPGLPTHLEQELNVGTVCIAFDSHQLHHFKLCGVEHPKAAPSVVLGMVGTC